MCAPSASHRTADDARAVDRRTWSDLDELFHRMLEVDVNDRDALIASACPTALRDPLRCLLEAHDAGVGDDFLQPPALDSHDVDGRSRAAGLVGALIGPYRLVRLIAVGGMGAVFEARHTETDEPCAVKILAARFLSHHAIRRFEFEAETLGRLRHPAIARIHASGIELSDDDPLPWIAMDLIERARTIDAWMQDASPSIDARIDIMLALCDAVQHAHQHGVIHRDLKPDNVLIDAFGQPKLVDFGIARAVEPHVGTSVARTATGQFIGTLQYMSPEQLGPDTHLIDTRCDVYALGLLLYELMCASRPYDVTHASLAEAARIVRETAPRRPSTAEPGVRGDLETIIRKAIEKDPSHRYQTPAELAADLTRFRNGEPIHARPTGTWRQLRSLAQRNRTATTLVATLALAILGFGIGMSVLAVNASRAEERARAESATSRAVAGSLIDIFRSFDPVVDASDFASGALTTDELLQRAERIIRDGAVDDPGLHAQLMHALGDAYLRQGFPQRAEPLLRHALATRTATFGSRHTDTAYSALVLATCRLQQQDSDEARTLAETARDSLLAHGPSFESPALEATVTLARALQAAGDQSGLAMLQAALDDAVEATGPDSTAVARVLIAVADWHYFDGQFERAGQLLEEAVAVNERHDMTIARKVAVWRLSQIYVRTNRPGDATAVLTALHERLVDELGPDHPHVASTLYLSAQAELAAKRPDRAADSAKRAIAIQRAVLGQHHPTTLRTLHLLGSIQLALGDLESADELLTAWFAAQPLPARIDDAILATIRDLIEAHRQRGEFDAAQDVRLQAINFLRADGTRLDALADFLERAGIVSLYTLNDSTAAVEQLAEAVAIRESQVTDEIDWLRTVGPLMHYLHALDAAGAIDALQQQVEAVNALRTLAAALPADHESRSGTALLLGVLATGLGDFETAEREFRRALEIRERDAGAAHHLTGFAHMELGWCLMRQGKRAAAEPHLLHGYELLRAGYDAHHAYVIEAARRIADLYDANGRENDARQWRSKMSIAPIN